jgi:peptidoglycan/xylan/chitin deacetylase (PgdA/CDA1 family)
MMSVMALLMAVLLAGCGTSAASRPVPVVAQATTRIVPKPRVHRVPVARKLTNAFPQPSWRPYLGPVPILVYHDLGNAPASEPYPGLYMTDANFAQEMAWLHSQGYQAVTLDELMSAWYHGGTLPAKPIVITFDNGYPPQVTEAPHVMSQYGWPGVLNEITEDHLRDDQIRSVFKLGWEVDSHSLTHPDMTTLDSTDLQAQLVDSRRFLQDTFHVPANSFCYPSSEYNSTVIAAVKAAGYTNATTEGDAYATRADPYLLPRFEMKTGLPELQADLATAH